MTGTRTAYLLTGDVDAVSATEHLERLLALIGAAATGPVVVDLAQTRLVDTTGLGMLINAHQAARDAGHRLVLRGANRRLVRLMEIAGTYELFDWEP